jgi:hypothetical protein
VYDFGLGRAKYGVYRCSPTVVRACKGVVRLRKMHAEINVNAIPVAGLLAVGIIIYPIMVLMIILSTTS